MKTIKIEKACLSIKQFKDCYLKNSYNENILNSDGSINKNYNSKKKTGLIAQIIEDGWNKMPVDEKNFILKYRKNADIEIKKVIDCHNKNLGCSVYECPECGNNLYRISTKRNNIETVFYYCSTYVKTKKCNKHYILEKELDNIVLESLNKHIELVCEIDTKIDDVVSTSKVEYNSELKKIRLNEINKELEINKLNIEKENLSKNKINSYNLEWINQVKKIGKLQEIDRNIVDSFIKNIFVNDDKSVDIIFRYKDEYKNAIGYLKSQNNVL